MKQDKSWESLFKPGEATDYFTIPDPMPIKTGALGINLSNAWWLAEISRLIYHPDFSKDSDINFGSLRFELLASIANEKTSTHVALIKVIQENPCLVIAFRGSDEIEDWGINARAYQTSFNEKGKVHRGFKKAYLSIKEELVSGLEYNSLPVFITGHSLGAALAVLASTDLYEDEYFDSCYTFGSPRIGNPEFVDYVRSNNVYRIVNNSDVVTTVPIDFAAITYKHVGLAYLLDDEFTLQNNLNEEDIYSYQKNRLGGLKDYARSKLFKSKLNTIKNDLPSFLADHAPINYVLAIQEALHS
jgi:hypothetical protein